MLVLSQFLISCLLQLAISRKHLRLRVTGLSNNLPTVTYSSDVQHYSARNEVKALVFSVSTIFPQQSLCHSGKNVWTARLLVLLGRDMGKE